jgi:ferritin
MKLTSSLEDALNRQIGMEFAAAHAYLSMSAYFEENAWDGFASWMAAQSDEEHAHAMKFYRYLLDRDGQVKLPEIPAPINEFASPLDVFESSLSQEHEVTSSIFSLYKMAHDSADYATVSFLKWFVDEQVEEEKNVSDMIEKLRRADGNNEAMIMLDRMAGERPTEDSSTE